METYLKKMVKIEFKNGTILKGKIYQVLDSKFKMVYADGKVVSRLTFFTKDVVHISGTRLPKELSNEVNKMFDYYNGEYEQSVKALSKLKKATAQELLDFSFNASKDLFTYYDTLFNKYLPYFTIEKKTNGLYMIYCKSKYTNVSQNMIVNNVRLEEIQLNDYRLQIEYYYPTLDFQDVEKLKFISEVRKPK